MGSIAEGSLITGVAPRAVGPASPSGFQLAADSSVSEPPAGVTGAPPEVVRQRDDTGRVRVERQVALDEAGAYVNHGVWRSWDADGKLIGQGRYAWGKPAGPWSRWAARQEASLLGAEPFVRFAEPFLSQATFVDGRLEGDWTVFDADGRRVSQVAFRGGERHGPTTLWMPDGSVYRRSVFDEGLPVGDLVERGADGTLRVTATFDAGRRRHVRESAYPEGRRRSREELLGPLTVAAHPDDPWRLVLARYGARGEPLRDGRREEWWPNGQPKLVAEYRLGQAVGEARWWHANGQLASRGVYDAGLAQGDWSWWRASGVRAASCRFVAGKPVGEWSRWAADGTRLRAPGRAQLADLPGGTLR